MMIGTLRTLSTGEYYDIKSCLLSTDICLLIVRERPELTIRDKKLIHVPELAPSYDLLEKFEQLKQEYSYKEAYVIYRQEFIYEMNTKIFKRNIDQIIKRLKEGKNIYLICDCKYEEHCHRSIIFNHIERRIKNYDNKYQ
jgi:uncharacterized protein YeaO (DUF488 family)